MKALYALVPFSPLIAAILAGFFRKTLGKRGAHGVTILGVAVSFVASIVVLIQLPAGGVVDINLYEWMRVGDLSVSIGFRVDALTAMMMLVITFVSLMVHIYTIGYMAEDDGYQRFFAYISLFTFSMLMLVMANNLLQLFFGWEAVGLVSYLLIGFWYTRESAIFANMKAFIVNRIGDLGFLLGIGLVVWATGSMHYSEIFPKLAALQSLSLSPFGITMPLLDLTAVLLFIGAMGKSAQVPLHVWLPDSMEGPTPISALIHAATMVTAGIFMVARMSPLFELAPIALSIVLVIGATTGFFMGLIGLVQNDIKRVIAYSTLSQLGYMTAALGASAYSVAVFHLATHAFFKALLFLAAGSVIMGMHHQQDMRYMGGLRKLMPITFWTALIGTLALIGTPGFAGFFSKDLIIEAVGEMHHLGQRAGAGYAYVLLTAGVLVTSFYSFRLMFMTFFGAPRYDQAPHDDHAHHDDHGHQHHPHESPWVVTLPLILLAIPSIFIGGILIGPWIFGDFFQSAIVMATGNPIEPLREKFHGAMAMMLHAFLTLPFWLALAGFILAWLFYIRYPSLPQKVTSMFPRLTRLLENKYFVDEFNQAFWVRGSLALGRMFWGVGDRTIIDGLINGTANAANRLGLFSRRLQSGALSQYTLTILLGLVIFILFLMFH